MSLETHKKSIFVFDFDGVVCDSTIECLLVSWNAWQTFFGLSDIRYSKEQFTNEEVEFFFPRRPLVKGAAEYFPLWLEYFSKVPDLDFEHIYDKDNIKPAVLNKYRSIFYECREAIKNRSDKYWLDLHFVFDDLIPILKKLNALNKLYIATLKDERSVSLILSWCGIPLSDTKIFSQEKIKSKLDALEKIRAIESVAPESIFFFDDNANHLIKPRQENFQCFLTVWGAEVPKFLEIAKKNSIDLMHAPSNILPLVELAG